MTTQYDTLDDARTALLNRGALEWIETDADEEAVAQLMRAEGISPGEAIIQHYGDRLDDADRAALRAE